MDRVDALSIPEICSLIASLLNKKDLGNCACASKRWHSFFTPFLWKHLRSHTTTYSVIAPFQQPMRFGTTTVLVSSGIAPSAQFSALPASSPTPYSSHTKTDAKTAETSSSVHSDTTTRSVISAHPYRRSVTRASPPTVPPFSSTLAKYGHHIYSLDIQARDLPLFVEHCQHVAQLKVTIFSDSGWDHLKLFAEAHPALSKLDLQLKGPLQFVEGVAQLLATQLPHLRSFELGNRMEISSSTLLDILVAGKNLDSLTIGTCAFIRIGETELSDDEEDEDDFADYENGVADPSHGHGESHMPVEGSTYHRSSLRRLTVQGGIHCGSIVEILRCSPGLQALYLDRSIPLEVQSLCRAIRFSCPMLETLSLGYFTAWTDASFARLVRAFGPTSRLRSISIPCTYAGNETILALADHHCQTLEDLDIMGGMSRISSHAIQRLLMQCSRLKFLDLGKSSSRPKPTALEAEDMQLGPWACHQLEFLILPIVGCVITHGGAAAAATCSSKDGQDEPIDERTTNEISGSNVHVIDYSEHVYKQLGALHHLKVLDIGGSGARVEQRAPAGAGRVESSPRSPSSSTVDSHLAWTLASGLHHLHRLSQLSML
ncbi:hypothetical protein BGZ73_006850, partial [Actinomortierella ambigua]